MIIWLNEALGAGKSTTARHVVDLMPEAHLVDAEQVGYMLRSIALPSVGDFQHWSPWRGLVVETARQVLDYVGGTLVIPQTVLRQQYWSELRQRFADATIEVCHVVLHAGHHELTRRIEGDPGANTG